MGQADAAFEKTALSLASTPGGNSPAPIPIHIQTSPPPFSNRRRVQRQWKVLVFVCVVVGVALCIRYVRLGNVLTAVAKWIEHHQVAGVLAMVGVFAVSIPVCVPSTVCEALCGLLFGWVGGAAVSSIGKTIGSAVAFVLGRYFFTDHVVVWMQKYPVVRAISLVFESDSASSWQLLLCTQMSYVPLTIKCYMLSVLNVSTLRFVLTNFVCGIPYSLFWSYVGSQANDVAKLFSAAGKARREKLAIMGCGIGSGLLGLVAVGYYAKRKLRELQEAASRQQHAVAQVRVGQDAATTEGSSSNSLGVSSDVIK